LRRERDFSWIIRHLSRAFQKGQLFEPWGGDDLEVNYRTLKALPYSSLSQCGAERFLCFNGRDNQNQGCSEMQ
jgi:hypothetical protein